MDSKKRLGYNIANLARSFNVSHAQIAATIGVSPSYMSELVNGKKINPEQEKIAKIAGLFGISPESLLNDDFSYCKPVTDPSRFVQMDLQELLPLFGSPESLTNSHFAKGFLSQKKLYENLHTYAFTSQEQIIRLSDTIMDSYSEVEEEGIIAEECIANIISFMFFMLQGGRGADILSRNKYNGDEYPLLISQAIKGNHTLEKHINSQLDNIEEEFSFRDMREDSDLQESIVEMLKELKGIDRWNDLVEYYLCLQYIIGAVDNAFSIEQNHDFGADLMTRYALIGNTYARNYMRKMIVGVD